VLGGPAVPALAPVDLARAGQLRHEHGVERLEGDRLEAGEPVVHKRLSRHDGACGRQGAVVRRVGRLLFVHDRDRTPRRPECSNDRVYIRVWEYRVAGEHRDAFVAAYGKDGDWALLFGRAPGHLGTELYGGIDDVARFVTVDRWSDEAAWQAFLERWGEDYASLDTSLERLTQSDTRLVEGTD
jgi:hypothetical protein